MSEQPRSSVPPRDVPPPRPVGPAEGRTGEPVEGEVLGGSPSLADAGRALADAVAGLLGREGAPGTGRSRAGVRTSDRNAAGVLADVVAALGGAARSSRRGSGAARPPRDAASGSLLTDLLDAAAPRLPIRDRERLRRAYPGASDEEIADALVARAARLTGGIGAATGGLAAAQWMAPPTLLAVPVELGAQTLLVAAVEIVLIGELHELHGRPAPGDARRRALAYLNSWTTQSAVGSRRSTGVISALGAAGAAALQRQVARRLRRGRGGMGPLLVGATLAARANRKGTADLAQRVLADLRTPRAPGRP
ncbi:hypothetical protein [Modestobacter marinus]|uniref:hypothetical protein n=1 Tax=Modestobacter marinus TaxID=477641 RepID=UPI001C94C638|nr:hypothetical protein [Modestobacter marinus]